MRDSRGKRAVRAVVNHGDLKIHTMKDAKKEAVQITKAMNFIKNGTTIRSNGSSKKLINGKGRCCIC